MIISEKLYYIVYYSKVQKLHIRYYIKQCTNTKTQPDGFVEAQFLLIFFAVLLLRSLGPSHSQYTTSKIHIFVKKVLLE